METRMPTPRCPHCSTALDTGRERDCPRCGAVLAQRRRQISPEIVRTLMSVRGGRFRRSPARSRRLRA
jgi:uncharacterized paraquat-inducible protein A